MLTLVDGALESVLDVAASVLRCPFRVLAISIFCQLGGGGSNLGPFPPEKV